MFIEEDKIQKNKFKWLIIYFNMPQQYANILCFA